MLLRNIFPEKQVVIRPHDKPWMDGNVRRAIRKRNRLLKRYSRHKTPASQLGKIQGTKKSNEQFNSIEQS